LDVYYASGLILGTVERATNKMEILPSGSLRGPWVMSTRELQVNNTAKLRQGSRKGRCGLQMVVLYKMSRSSH
jgi:hypothetical protein